MGTEVLKKEIETTEAKPIWMELWERKITNTEGENVGAWDAYWEENMEELMALFREMQANDTEFPTEEEMDEIAEMVSKDRREHYEASLRG